MQFTLFDEPQTQQFHIMLGLEKEHEDFFIQEKQNIIHAFGPLFRTDSTPHITLVHMELPENKAEEILNRIELFFKKQGTIEFYTNQYLGFKSNRLIAAKVDINPVFETIYNFFNLLKLEYPILKKDKYFSVIKLPHITLCHAGNLKEFEALEHNYFNQQINLNAKASLLLIRKAEGKDGKFKTYKKIQLNVN